VRQIFPHQTNYLWLIFQNIQFRQLGLSCSTSIFFVNSLIRDHWPPTQKSNQALVYQIFVFQQVPLALSFDHAFKKRQIEPKADMEQDGKMGKTPCFAEHSHFGKPTGIVARVTFSRQRNKRS
jgi:hypothetical protein